MKKLPLLFALFVSLPLAAQEEETAATETDRVTLVNGDALTGKVLSMADGVVKFESVPLGEVDIPLDQIADLRTAGRVVLLTTEGERIERRITGIEGGALQLAPAAEGAPDAPALAVSRLDKINPPKPKVRWKGTLNIGASLSTGNTDRRSASTSLELIRRSADDRITADASWIYSEEKTAGVWNLTDRRTEGGLKYDYFLSERSYLLAATRAVGDTLSGLDLRFTTGAGYGYQWIEEDDLSLSTEVGLNYFFESFRTPGVPNDDFVAVRAAYRFEWAIADGMRFLQDVEAFPGLERSDDIYVTKDSRLRLDLLQGMFAQLQWLLDFDNTPSPGADRLDNRYVLSVGWTF